MRKIYFYLIAAITFIWNINVMAEGKTAYAGVADVTIENGGIVSLDLSNPTGPSYLWDDMMICTYAGTMAEGKYYAVIDQSMGSGTPESFCTLEFNSKTINELGEFNTPLKDMTYDVQSKTMYGITNDNEKSTIYTIDKADGTLTPFAEYPGIGFNGIAADGKGNLYVISTMDDEDGKLYVINIASKVHTPKGKLGLKPDRNSGQSIEFNEGNLYWLAYAYDGGGMPKSFLATINIETGAATKVNETTFPAQLTGLCFSKPTTSGGSDDPEPEPENYMRTTTVDMYGDSMGDQPDKLTKKETFFYDADNNVQRSILQAVTLEDEWTPIQYRTYVYNDKKQLTEKYYRQWGIYDGHDKAWGDIKGKETYKYNEDGKLIEKADESRRYVYVWEGNNIVKDTTYSALSGDTISYTTYSNFVEGAANCPQTVVSGGKWDSYIFTATYTYDENHNKLSYIALNSKGENKAKEIWEYNDAGELIGDTVWTVKNGKFVYKNYTAYTITDNKTKTQGYEWYERKEDGETITGWATKPTHTVTTVSEYHREMAPKDLTITNVEGKANTVQLSFDIPSPVAIEFPAWDVYRDGAKIGRATLDQAKGKYVYTDESVWNGKYDYFVQTVDEQDATAKYNISNVVTQDIYTELPPVTNVHYVSHEISKDKMYIVTIGWDAPETELTIKGYNVFRDIRTIPENDWGTIIEGTSTAVDFGGIEYPESLKRTITVEAVYNIGKVKAEPVEIDLAKYVSIDNNSLQDLIQVEGNIIFVNEKASVEIIGANGMLINRYEGVPAIDTNVLPQGIYILRVNYNGETCTMKMVKR